MVLLIQLTWASDIRVISASQHSSVAGRRCEHRWRYLARLSKYQPGPSQQLFRALLSSSDAVPPSVSPFPCMHTYTSQQMDAEVASVFVTWSILLKFIEVYGPCDVFRVSSLHQETNHPSAKLSTSTICQEKSNEEVARSLLRKQRFNWRQLVSSRRVKSASSLRCYFLLSGSTRVQFAPFKTRFLVH